MRNASGRSIAVIGFGAVALCLVFVCLSPRIPARGQQAPALPSGPGMAAKYRGDAGIERDSRVLFCENFEAGDLGKIAKHWNDVGNKDGKVLALSDEVPPDSSGKHSLQMTATLGENQGGSLYTLLSRPVDKAFARFNVKFAPDADYIHHFVHFGGYNPPTRWAQGGAG